LRLLAHDVRRSRWAIAAVLGVCLAAAPLSAGTSTQKNPTVVFATPGAHTVTLNVCNVAGCKSVTKTVNVLDPTPVITASAIGWNSAEAGQLVQLTGAGTGQPPLDFTWRTLLGATLAGQTAGANGWLDTTGLAPGAYVLTLRLQNPAGMVEAGAYPLVISPAQASDFYTVAPCRLVDTRFASPLAVGIPRQLDTAGLCDIPANARALSVNVTVVSATGQGNLVLYPGNYPQPLATTINYALGETRSNFAIVPLATNGAGTLGALASQTGGGTAQILVDVTGYFAVAP
jgi:hypothetical protein